MNKNNNGILSLVIAILAAPVGGLLVSEDLLRRIAESYGGDPLFEDVMLLKTLSFVALAATLALPLLYSVTLVALGGHRAALARVFPLLVRVCLVLLPVVLAAHAALLAFGGYVMLESRLVRLNGYVLAGYGLVIAGLALSAFNILMDLRRMLAIEPLRATGIAPGGADEPRLRERVNRIAARLGAPAPRNIVIGVEPTLYMVSMPVRLRGIADLPDGETLYLPTLALTLLDDAELDALLARELAHFTGPDLVFSRRFAPAHASLVNAVDSVDENDHGENKVISMARMPALGMLTYMLWLARMVLARANRARELAADAAARAVAPDATIVAGIVKMIALHAQWDWFRRDLAELMNRGVGRRNIAQDYLLRTRQFLGVTDQKALRKNLERMSTPHPLDAHPPLDARAHALGVDLAPVIAAAVRALAVEKPVDAGIRALEERITADDLDYIRVPGHPVQMLEDPALPADLAYKATA